MTTPARKQYLDIKAQHQDAILLYQVGDFFETFDEDATIAARELHIALTSRSYGPHEVVPLAGVPVHALETYAARLVARGYRVAVCEQVSPPGRGLVQREVTRILTPGTVTEPAMVPTGRDNYLAAVAHSPASRRAQTPAVGLAYVEPSTGAFACAQWDGAGAEDALLAELDRIAPAEVLMADDSWHDGTSDGHAHGEAALHLADLHVTTCPQSYFDGEGARIRLCRHFGVPTLAAFGCEDAPLAAAAAGALLAYLQRMNPALVKSLADLRRYDTGDTVRLDGRTWRALEVVEPHRPPGERRGPQRTATLLDVLDCTQTAMGARLLRRTLLQPLRDRAELQRRLDAVDELHRSPDVRERLAAVFRGMGDLGRLAGRLVQGTATTRELLALAAALARVPDAVQILTSADSAPLRELRAALDPCADVRAAIESAVADPAHSPGRLLRDDYDAELDELVRSSAEARAWIAALEPRERERTGIKSLKVGYNKVFGYYIEVSHANRARVPDDYQRRQTLTNGERYVTEDLKRFESLVLHAEEQIEALERRLYIRLLDDLARHGPRLQRTAAALAQLDVWLALAETAMRYGYVRPELCDTTELDIRGGRHPIVERRLDGAQFTANGLSFAGTEADGAEGEGMRVMLLTGPNMAGKSTFLRQVALIVLLAQIGSFVPADSARIGLVDRIFTRVGAEDDLAAGLSTFMLEMVETAYILRHATERSLIVLDEVGRGTSTRDGLAIARAVLEHIHDRVGARTLFATHFHELAALAEDLPHVAVYRMDVAERDGEAVFLHRVVPGASDESYGVQVARMAGVPASVTERARDLLATALVPAARIRETQATYDARPVAPARHDDREFACALAGLDIASTTPIEALNILYALHQRAVSLLAMGGG